METPTTSLGFSRRRLIAGGLVLGAAPMLPRFLSTAGASPLARLAPLAPSAFGFPEPDMTSQIVRPIEFPVEGEVSWTDTYGACRDGCSRRHEGEDLLGHKLQRLIACVDGTVVGFKFDPAGNYLYLQDADGWNYGYLHINNDDPGTDDGHNPRQWAFAPGIDAGVQVRKGQFIAYLGDSGNAESTVPHCHFEIRKPADAWYHGQAINPKYSLDAASHGGTAGVPATTFAPWSTAGGFAAQQYLDFLDRPAQSGELAAWAPQLDSGAKSPADVIEWLIGQPGSSDAVAPLIRLYMAFFNRIPDSSGLMFWISQIRDGTSLDQVADTFSKTSESRRRFGASNDGQYIDQLYLTILGKSPDSAGRAYWVQQLSSGMSRGRAMRYFVETDRNRFITYTPVRVCMVYAGMLRRAPDRPGYDYWINQSNGGMPLQTMISSIKASASYQGRFPTAA